MDPSKPLKWTKGSIDDSGCLATLKYSVPYRVLDPYTSHTVPTHHGPSRTLTIHDPNDESGDDHHDHCVGSCALHLLEPGAVRYQGGGGAGKGQPGL